jgi:GNAT superfamily N-acetyltransferase
MSMNSEGLTIRPAVLGDLDDLVQLLQALFALEEDFSPDPERQRLGLKLFLDGCGKHRCLMVTEDAEAAAAKAGGAVADGAVIAMASVQILISTAEGGPVGMVEDVVVRRDHRGRGVGRLLMAELSRWADQRGLKRLQLLADRHNRPALDFYAQMGWQPTELICLRRS